MEALKQLVLEFPDIFRMELGRDPPAQVEPMEVQLIEGDDLKMHRARRFAPLQMEFLDNHVRLLLEMKVIKKSRSNYASPIVLARKSDGSWRMCVDLILSGLLFLRLLTCSEDIGNFRLRPIVQKIWRLLHTKGCMSSRTAAVWNQDKAYKVQFVREEHSLVRYDN